VSDKYLQYAEEAEERALSAADERERKGHLEIARVWRRRAGQAPRLGPDDRAHPREEVMRRGVVVHGATGASIPCTIIDISLGGARLQLYAPNLPGDELSLIDADKGTMHDLRVAWRNGDFVGVAFEATVDLPGD
jgi:hypothetical protein